MVSSTRRIPPISVSNIGSTTYSITGFSPAGTYNVSATYSDVTANADFLRSDVSRSMNVAFTDGGGATPDGT